MKKMPLAARICLLMTAALTPAVVIFRTVAMFVFYDREIGYFTPAISTVLTVLSVCLAVLCIVLSIITPKNSLPTIWPEGKRNIIAVAPAACFIIGGIGTLVMGLIAKPFDKMLLILAILSLLSSFYYIAIILRTKASALSLWGFLPVFWGIMVMVITYTDQYTTMNSPIKLGLQFGFLGLMLATLAELRFRLNKPAPRAALCFHCFALFFGFTGSIPTLAHLVPHLFDMEHAPANTALHCVYALILLGVCIYTSARLFTYFTTPPAEAAPATEVQDTIPDIQTGIEAE